CPAEWVEGQIEDAGVPALVMSADRIERYTVHNRAVGPAPLPSSRWSDARCDGVQLPKSVGHLDRGDGGVEALVACFGAGALDRLLDGVGGEHPEDDRDAGGKRDVRHALGD